MIAGLSTGGDLDSFVWLVCSLSELVDEHLVVGQGGGEFTSAAASSETHLEHLGPCIQLVEQVE